MKKFNELEGYNLILEYCSNVLEFIKRLNSNKIDEYDFNSITGSKYDYANAKITTTLQSLLFFQLYEKYGKDIDINKVNIDSILDIIQNVEMKSSEQLSTDDKELIFRNCLAHGRYTLVLDDEGEINIHISEKNTIIKNNNDEHKKIEFIEGNIHYVDFLRLAKTYKNVFNLERNALITNEKFEFPRTLKNLSANKIFEMFLKSLLKISIKLPMNYNGNSERELGFGLDRSGNVIKMSIPSSYKDMKKPFEKARAEKSDLKEEEMEYFKKYFNFIGRRKLIKLFNLKIIRQRKFSNLPKKREKSKEYLNDIAMDQEYHVIISNILNSKSEKWCNNVSGMSNNNLLDFNRFLLMLPKLDEINSFEKASTKEADEVIQLRTGMDMSLLHMTRRQKLKENLEGFSYLYPLLYSNLLSLNLYYAIGYANEVNNNYSKELFDYKNIDLSEFNPTYDDISRPCIKTVDPHKDAIKRLEIKKVEGRDSKVNKLINNLNKANENFANIRNLLIKEGYTQTIDL